MVTVIDDSILGGQSYREVRQFLRDNYIIKAVISLPGDAFQRSLARVKTSLLMLQKKRHVEEAQPAVFMYCCGMVGVDDSSRQRQLPIDEENRRRADEEILRVASLYDDYLRGREAARPWTVPPERIADRIDVKHCLVSPARRVETWRRKGGQVVSLDQLLEVVYQRDSDTNSVEDNVDIIDTSMSSEVVTHLRVRYDGIAESGDEIRAADSNYARLFRVRSGDLVISHINAVHGAVALVPEEFDGFVVTNEYSVCRARPGVDPYLVWALLPSPEIRADLLLTSTGIGRSRVKWEGGRPPCRCPCQLKASRKT